MHVGTNSRSPNGICRRRFKDQSESARAQPILRAWVRLASGEERVAKARFSLDAGGWALAPDRPLTEPYWRQLFAFIDPATGEFVPGGVDRFRRGPVSP